MKMVDWLLRLVRALLVIPRCTVCDEMISNHEQRLCADCRKRYETEKAKACSRCGFAHIDCRCGIIADGVYYPIYHTVPYDPKNTGVVSRMVFTAKDEYLRANFNFISDECAKALLRHEKPKTDWVITFIPRRKAVINKVGHDQSREIAKRLARRFGCKVESVFVNHGRSAQKSQAFKGRVKNAYASYKLKKRAYSVLRNKIVVLVDDLTTTGATQQVCIELARKTGTNRIIPLVFAKTDRGFKKYKMRLGG